MSPSRPAPWWPHVAAYGPGLVAGAAMIAVAEALAALVRLRVGVVGAVAELVRDVAPGAAVEGFIALVGTWDKPLLSGMVVAGALVLAAVSGRWRWGLLGLVGLGAVGLTAVLVESRRSGEAGASALTGAVPAVVATAVGVALLQVLLDARRASEQTRNPDARRRVLVLLGVVATGAVLTGAASRVIGGARRGVEQARAALRLDVTGGRVPAGADLDVAGLGPWRVAAADFYRIDTAFAVPLVHPDDWRLRIHGMVEREVELGFADLVERERTEAWTTLTCVSNEVGGGLVGNAWWSGTRIAPLLAEAGVLPGADAVLQTSSDGWTCGTPLEALTDERDALLAYAMNGEPLPLEHGFPVRMVVPGLYGYVSATKWVVDLEVTRFADFRAYWTERGWGERGPIKTQSRVLVPRPGDEVGAGEVVLAGDAWAQHTGIERVEVQVDGGAWREADLGTVPSRDTWVQWSTTVRLDPGEHVVVVRATDAAGQTQTATQVGVLPDGATGWDQVRFTVG
ncbi:molybdopterin-dependent oxidoreductase [Nocardioides zeae]|uniref:Molybdopterin-dependent oxidoreductase n=1 Tax=Nocardioides imazamoxiresistens TaxID=3231893 RepID=A0ABU3Q0Y1_9ACTN|nr:molybdopterin-dependent oxidoreductase [Nocardioides zeae]MDT9595172.1 molybdopterin-dependent oxidoreductase [Nocardioides zeae]